MCACCTGIWIELERQKKIDISCQAGLKLSIKIKKKNILINKSRSA